MSDKIEQQNNIASAGSLPKPIEKWVAALRSGKYKQGTGGLRDVMDRYCCLGVACDIYEKEVGPLEKSIKSQFYIYGCDASFLPIVVKQWLGVQSTRPYVKVKGEVQLLDYLNDAEYTFEEIADLIEKEFFKSPIKKWVAALRSGKYKQGTGALRDKGNNFCCLGVACDLYCLEVEPLSIKLKGNSYSYNGSTSFYL